jgi:hypothetical protein
MPDQHEVTEDWTGPGRCDGCIEPLPPCLASDFALAVTRDGESVQESGTTLHEIVLFKPVQQEAA